MATEPPGALQRPAPGSLEAVRAAAGAIAARDDVQAAVAGIAWVLEQVALERRQVVGRASHDTRPTGGCPVDA